MHLRELREISVVMGKQVSIFSVVMGKQVSIKVRSGHVCICEKELVVFSLLLKLLQDIPPETFSSTWTASWTFMVRRTSKTFKNLVEKLRFNLPAVVLFRKGHDARVAELAELVKMQV